MDTRTILELAMIKCAMKHNPKDINEWCDTKTHGQLSKDLAEQLYVSGYCLQKIDPLPHGNLDDINLDDISNLDGE